MPEDKKLETPSTPHSHHHSNLPVSLHPFPKHMIVVMAIGALVIGLSGAVLVHAIWREQHTPVVRTDNVDTNATTIEANNDSSGTKTVAEKTYNDSNTIVGGFRVYIYQSRNDDKSYTASIPAGGTLTFTSDAAPAITAFNGNDLRYILRTSTGLNANFYIVSASGKLDLLMTEPDDQIYLDTGHTAISHDNTKLTYTAVSSYKEGCGGPLDFKVANFSGSVLELRTMNLDTKQTQVVIKDEHNPDVATSEKLSFGLKLLGYASDNTKGVVIKRGAPSCGGLEDIGAYTVNLTTNGAIKAIPYQHTLTGSVATYADTVSPDGKYFYYTEDPGTATGQITHRYDLATGADIIVK